MNYSILRKKWEHLCQQVVFVYIYIYIASLKWCHRNMLNLCSGKMRSKVLLFFYHWTVLILSTFFIPQDASSHEDKLSGHDEEEYIDTRQRVDSIPDSQESSDIDFSDPELPDDGPPTKTNSSYNAPPDLLRVPSSFGEDDKNNKYLIEASIYISFKAMALICNPYLFSLQQEIKKKKKKKKIIIILRCFCFGFSPYFHFNQKVRLIPIVQMY